MRAGVVIVESGVIYSLSVAAMMGLWATGMSASKILADGVRVLFVSAYHTSLTLFQITQLIVSRVQFLISCPLISSGDFMLSHHHPCRLWRVDW
jgi:hypothetical protein